MRPLALFAFLSTLSVAPVVSAQIAQDLGAVTGSANRATALSGDGAVVVGFTGDWHSFRAFRWTAATGMQDLGHLGGSSARAFGVSSDGDVIVGESTLPSGEVHAFRWVQGVGLQDLGTLGGTYSSAQDVSADGQVVVGMWGFVGSADRAFRWTQATGMMDLGDLGSPQARALGVSGDGTVVVGLSHNAAEFRAFRWTAAGGMTDLGTPPNGDLPQANATNADGSVVVGKALDTALGYTRAFRWTAAGGAEWLADLGGHFAEATDVDAAGLVIVGKADTPAVGIRLRAFRWTAATGAVELRGISRPTTEAYGVSADGGAAAGRSSGSLMPGVDEELVLRWRWSTVGSVYCGAELNSTGGPAALTVYGSLAAAHRDLALRAEGMPHGSWAYVLSSRDAGLVFPFPDSQGRLCVGGTFGRHNGAGDVKRTSGLGDALVWILDPGALPSPTGPVVAQPGETWHFQVWYRDANPSATSNLTDAIALTFH